MFRIPTKGTFARDVSVLASGTALAQICSFLLYPIIGRLYTPEDMALLAVYTSLFTILQVLSTGKYETSIFLAKTETDAASLVSLVVSLCFSFCIVITIIFVGCGDIINSILRVDLGKLLFFVPLSILSITIFDTYNEWCIRKKYFSKLSLNKISNSFLVNGGKVGFAYTPLNSYGLIIGDVIGRLLSALVCVFRIWKADRQDFRGVNVSTIREQAVQFSKFPKFQMPSQLLNTLGASVPVLILSSYYDVSEVGHFSMAIAVMSVPIGVIGRAIRDVSRKKLKDSIGEQMNIYGLFRSLFKKALIVSTTVALLFVFFLPWIFSFVLGDQWFQSGVYAQIMTPMFIASFVATCVESTNIVAMKLKWAFLWQLLYSVCNIAPIVVGFLLKLPMIPTLILYSSSLVVCYLVLVLISRRSSKYLDRLSLDEIKMLNY